MELKQQDNDKQVEDVSPLVRDKTYGERMYHLVFNQGINFALNLLVSAGFSQWTANSVKPFKLPGMKEAVLPRDMQQKVADKVEQSWVIQSMKAEPEIMRKRAFGIAEILTLLVPGHLIMIPSVWLGAKIKPAFVRHFDRSHYGENAEADPSIAYRHAMIDAEAKPTFLGAVVGRVGTMAATATVSRLIGTEDNLISKHVPGAQNFKGLNPAAKQIGEVIGGGAAKEVKAVGRFNTWLSGKMNWSNEQVKRGVNLNAQGVAKNYDHAVADYVGFTSMDTLYTIVTATTIHPIMSLLRHVPGMTYRTHPPLEKKIVTETGDETKLRVPRNRMALSADTAPIATHEPAADAPRLQVSGIEHDDRVRHSQQEVSAG